MLQIHKVFFMVKCLSDKKNNFYYHKYHNFKGMIISLKCAPKSTSKVLLFIITGISIQVKTLMTVNFKKKN